MPYNRSMQRGAVPTEASGYALSQVYEANEPGLGYMVGKSDIRASKLLLALYEKLGFEIVLKSRGLYWVKAVDGHILSIDYVGGVLLNHTNICLITNDNSTPFADQIVAKLLALSTAKGRKEISTISEEHENVLKQLLPEEETSKAITEFFKERENVQETK